jgi:small subunit ribosomal protein S3
LDDMGQKIHPKIIRVGISREWSSKWFSDKEFPKFLLEDYKIRKILEDKHKNAGIAEIEISRSANDTKVTIHTSKPGILIGRGGAGIEVLRKEIEKITKRKTGVVIEEISDPDNHAVLIGKNIAEQVEKRIPYRRAVKMAIENVMKSGARGVRVRIGGRLNGADIARVEMFSLGKIPLSSLKEDIDHARVTARTTYGAIGIKVWVYRKLPIDKKIL